MNIYWKTTWVRHTQNSHRRNVKYEATTDPKCDSIPWFVAPKGWVQLINFRFLFSSAKVSVKKKIFRSVYEPANWIQRKPWLTAANQILNRAHKSFVLRDMANRSCRAPSCLATYSLACRTKRNFLRMLHGCNLTDCNTSLCRRIFSKICSFVDSWCVPSPNDIAVLNTRPYVNEKWIEDKMCTYSPELVVKTLERRLSPGIIIWLIWLDALLGLTNPLNLRPFVLARLCITADTDTE